MQDFILALGLNRLVHKRNSIGFQDRSDYLDLPELEVK